MTVPEEIFLVEGHGTTNETQSPLRTCSGCRASRPVHPRARRGGRPDGVADQLTGVTQLPAGVSLAATWDPSLAYQYGQVVGSEERGKGADVNLGPTVNIDRDPRWGRSFEAFTEDPFLNAALATSEIDGVQSRGVDVAGQALRRLQPGDQPQHAGRQRDRRDRALHEIYLPAFKAAVTQARRPR